MQYCNWYRCITYLHDLESNLCRSQVLAWECSTRVVTEFEPCFVLLYILSSNHDSSEGFEMWTTHSIPCPRIQIGLIGNVYLMMDISSVNVLPGKCITELLMSFQSTHSHFRIVLLWYVEAIVVRTTMRIINSIIEECSYNSIRWTGADCDCIVVLKQIDELMIGLTNFIFFRKSICGCNICNACGRSSP